MDAANLSIHGQMAVAHLYSVQRVNVRVNVLGAQNVSITRPFSLTSKWVLLSGVLVSGILLIGCQPQDETGPVDTDPGSQVEATRPTPGWIDTQRVANADSEPENWLMHGRTASEQRFSPLTQINDTNVDQLGLAWYIDLDTSRGQQATPIIVDGLMYSSSAWSKVQVLDAATGELKWQFDPQISKEWDVKSCCGVQNRGVAVWQGHVYVGTIDGRLIALNADTGEVVWEVQTTDPSGNYSITGAPRIAKGKVIIGNGGAEYLVRGYVTAYDAQTGEQAWRFYVVPGNPADGFESPAMEMAASTWTGEYVWHYQTVPGDTWDYTAVQHMILAELEIDGRERKVIMQAPKNGFFYVLDRETGELLSAEKFMPANWASHIDLETGPAIPDDLQTGRRLCRAADRGQSWCQLLGPPGYIP
jgi:quinohemoprotein ethanol dehydrogenase